MTTQTPLMKTSMTRRLGGALVALGLTLPASALAEDFVVNSNADPGDGVCDATECTLREAIAAANANGESDTITFDLAADDRVILLGGERLSITDDTGDPDLTIDGDVDGDGTPDITVDAQGNSGVFGIAGLESFANVNLEGLAITGGGNVFAGGGISNDSGTLTVTNSTISGNSATNDGGGIDTIDGVLTVTNSTISGNSAEFLGGGINNFFSNLTVTNSTVSGNSASQGGGIANPLGARTVVEGSTISGNSATFGGGFSNSVSTLTVTNSTISGNNAEFGGGIDNGFEGTAEIKSTIVANTATTGPDCFNRNGGTITSLGFNLEGGMSCGFTGTADQQNIAVTDVLVTDANGRPLLADNGGPTQTIALVDSAANPAIDAIPLADCTDIGGVPVETDQRGVDRPQPFPDGNCDIGAFELMQEAPRTIADVIDLFDQAVADGTLVGAGPGGSAAGRLNALRNMLLTAGVLLEQADVDGACTQLQDAANRTDGAFPPPDFAQGPAAPDLFDAITEVQGELGCFA